MALRLDEDRPARAQAAQGVVDAAGDTATTSAGEGGSPGRARESARCAGKLPSLLSTTPGRDQGGPGQDSRRGAPPSGDIRRRFIRDRAPQTDR